MKILIVGENDAFIKAFIKKHKGKYNITVALRDAEFSRLEQANELFREDRYDAVIYYIPFVAASNGNVAKLDELIKFKNIQYAAILAGIKKMLVLTDSLTLEREIKQENERAIQMIVPQGGGALTDYMITLLAEKDTISTVLRAFGLYGYSVKQPRSHAMKIIGAALSKKNLTIDVDGMVNALYVEDYYKIISAFLDNKFPRGIYNIAPDEKVSLSEIAKKARTGARKFEKEFTPYFNSKEIVFEHTASNQKLRGILPAFKFTQLTNGITKTLGEKK